MAIMNPTIERLYHEIGQSALSTANDLDGPLLVYSEVEDGVVSSDLIYADSTGNIRFRFCPKSLKNLIYTLWDQWRRHPGNREWRVMCYTIIDGKFAIDLVYPDQINGEEDVSDRRPLAIKKYFGEAKVDYSRP